MHKTDLKSPLWTRFPYLRDVIYEQPLRPITHYATFWGFSRFHIFSQYLPWFRKPKNLKTQRKFIFSSNKNNAKMWKPQKNCVVCKGPKGLQSTLPIWFLCFITFVNFFVEFLPVLPRPLALLRRSENELALHQQLWTWHKTIKIWHTCKFKKKNLCNF